MSSLAIAFDLDGLLLDSEPVFIEAARRLVAARGLPFDPGFMQTIMGMPARDALPQFRASFKISDTLEVIADEYRHHFIAAAGHGLVPLRRGARALVEQLHEAGARLVIATSSHRQYVEQVFGPHGLLDRFERLLTSDDVTRGKPHPEVYLLAASYFGVSADEMVVLEDSPHGVTAAKAAGAFCIAVPQEATPRAAVAGADLIAASLDDPVIRRRLNLETKTPAD